MTDFHSFSLLDWNPGHSICNCLFYENMYKILFSALLSLIWNIKWTRWPTFPDQNSYYSKIPIHFSTNFHLEMVNIQHSLYPCEKGKWRTNEVCIHFHEGNCIKIIDGVYTTSPGQFPNPKCNVWALYKPVLLNYLCCILQSLSRVWLFATPGRQHTRLPCPPPSPGVCSRSCPLFITFEKSYY